MIVALVALAVALAGGADGPPDTTFRVGWEKIAQTDGILVYRKEVPGSPVVAFMGEGLVDAPLAKVASVILDASRAREWVDTLAENRVLRRISDAEHIEYSHVATPFLVKDRDFVSRVVVSYDRPTATLVERIASVEDPLAPRTGHVRGRVIDGFFKLISLQGGNKTYFICQVHADPRGWLPKWIVNFFQRDWPLRSIRSLRKQVAKPDIREQPAVRKLLGLPD
jgi:hypothetical protein